MAGVREVREVLQAIDAAPSTEERLKWIADGARHRESVEQFFETQDAGLNVTDVDPNVGHYGELPSGKDVKLFMAVTAACPDGAMVRLHDEGGKRTLDWPLFQQTHQMEFDAFAADEAAPPRWFTVICARSRTSELPGSAKDTHLALRAQGSLTVQGEALLYVHKESTAGQFLESRMVWGRGYLVKALLGHARLDGKAVMTIEDCAGTGASAK